MNMTRENKLALVVGFGLVLFVGILISDHFSTARNQESADIRSGRLVDPLAQSRHDNATLIELPGSRPEEEASRRTGPLAMSPGRIENDEASRPSDPAGRRVDPVPPRNEIPRIVMGANNGDERSDSGGSGRRVDFVFHEVRPGESLIGIARRYYADDSLVKELARFNEIDNPDTIRVGHRLRIPEVDALRSGAAGRGHSSNEPSTDQPRSDATVYTTYTVKRGDTLSEISQELLGTARRWREIYEMNRDVIRDADNLIAGTELKIPRPGR